MENKEIINWEKKLENSYNEMLKAFYIANRFLPIFFVISNFFMYIDKSGKLRDKKTMSFFIVSLIYIGYLIYFAFNR
ncbi:MAG TPA: hypothetical protein VN854_00715 [Mycoplasmatales bacterium]|jgi:hypothetical protein|nr:hypothetical protein [Mycoplasmatales bacterium]